LWNASPFFVWLAKTLALIPRTRNTLMGLFLDAELSMFEWGNGEIKNPHRGHLAFGAALTAPTAWCLVGGVVELDARVHRRRKGISSRMATMP
jgi:hypothetical protein